MVKARGTQISHPLTPASARYFLPVDHIPPVIPNTCFLTHIAQQRGEVPWLIEATANADNGHDGVDVLDQAGATCPQIEIGEPAEANLLERDLV